MNLNREPVAIAAAVRSVIMAGVAFGLDWTPEQVVAFMFAVETVLAVVVRQQVTPTVKLPKRVPRKAAAKKQAGQTSLWTILLVLLIVLVVVLLVGPITLDAR